jgi:hypothetical protein
MEFDSIHPPFEFCSPPLVSMEAINLINVEQLNPPSQLCKSTILVQTNSNVILPNNNICIQFEPHVIY